MAIKINKEILMSLPQKPCAEGLEWYEKHGSEDLLKTLIDLNEYNQTWARWLFARMMNKKQCVEIAVFAAELVLPIYEKKHPNDKRTRDAIEAAKRYLKTGTADASAAVSAYAVADAAAVYVAAAASYAADASAAAAYDADCAAAASACATSADAAYAAAATVASAAAYAAAAAADAAASACATGAAADYAAAAAGAASVAAAASAASAADVAENKKQTELQIINEAARILERDNA
jgi:hypothetical protein